MMDSSDSVSPEVTIEPADNGYVVKHYQRSTKKDESGRTIRRVASTTDEALGHAKSAMGGGKTSKKKTSSRVGHVSDEAGESSPAPAAHSLGSRGSTRRRRARVSGRR